mgnify:CR=1 FL=1
MTLRWVPEGPKGAFERTQAHSGQRPAGSLAAAGSPPARVLLSSAPLSAVLQGFWRGWHSSYNQWLVRYMYVPLGGSTRRVWIIWPIFFFVALWHDLEVRLADVLTWEKSGPHTLVILVIFMACSPCPCCAVAPDELGLVGVFSLPARDGSEAVGALTAV